MTETSQPEKPAAVEMKIPTWRVEEFEKRFEALCKIARKVEAPEPTYRYTGVEFHYRQPKTDEDHRRIAAGDPTYPRKSFTRIEISGEAPRVPGFRLVGKIEPSAVAGVNLVSMAPHAGIEGLPFAKAPIECEHCQLKRGRKAVYLIESTAAGRVFRVGKSCLKDFTGHERPEWMAIFHEALGAMLDEEGWGMGSGGGEAYHIATYLAVVAACIEENGWAPRSASDYPTAARALDVINRTGPYSRAGMPYNSKYGMGTPLPEITEAHKERAAAALAWVRSLSPDPVVNRNDYLLKLRLCVEEDFAEPKRLGMIASAIGAYARQMEQELKLALRAKERGEAKPLPESDGRVQITGQIIAANWRETDYGDTLKITVRADDGWRVWGTAPASIGVETEKLIGRRITFMAKVERSRDDVSMGFFRRPTKAALIEEGAR